MQFGAWPGLDPRAFAKRSIMGLANRLANFGSVPRVSVPGASAGGVKGFVSVLFDPAAEFDPRALVRRRPRSQYFKSILSQMDLVERALATSWHREARLARSFDELEDALAADKVAVMHAVEGGFHLGGNPDEIRSNVSTLAERGVVYITLAHLIYRGVVTNVACLPPVPDSAYHLLFRQPGIGLSELGVAALERMFEEGILVDVKHMSRRALGDVLELYDRWDPDREVPIAVTHMACRLGNAESTIDDETIEIVAERGGLMGIIVAQQFMRPRDGAEPQDGIELYLRHIEHVCEVTGSHEHVAIGTDLDGFVRPIAGLDSYADFGKLAAAIEERFGADVAVDIMSGNALRVLERVWGRRRERGR